MLAFFIGVLYCGFYWLICLLQKGS